MSTSSAVLDSAPSAPRRASDSVTVPLVVAALTILALVPQLFVHFRSLWLKPHYQLFPMVLAGAFALAWPAAKFNFRFPGWLGASVWILAAGGAAVAGTMLADSSESGMFGPSSTWAALSGILLLAALPVCIVGGYTSSFLAHARTDLGMKTIVAAWVILAAAVFFSSPNFTLVATIIAIASLPLTIGGWPLFRRCLPAIAYLFLIVPPPFALDVELVAGLQMFAAKLSSGLLDLMGVYHNLAGVTIQAANNIKGYMVEEACSGISSLLSVLACVLFYVLYFKLHWLRSILLVLAAIGWVLINNVARVVLIVYLNERWSRDLTKEPAHTIFGIALFALTLFLLWSTDRLLMFFGRSEPVERRFNPLPLTTDGLRAAGSSAARIAGAWYRAMPFAALFGVLMALQLSKGVLFAQTPYSGSALSALYDGVTTTTLPAEDATKVYVRHGEMVKLERPPGDEMGRFSRLWTYRRKDGNELKVSFDYPFGEYHDLRVCYRNTGWTVTGEATKAFKSKARGGRSPLPCVRIELAGPVKKKQLLFFCNFDQDGIGVEPSNIGDLEAGNAAERAVRRISHTFDQWRSLFTSKTAAATGQGSILQVQLIYPHTKDIKEDEFARLQELFETAAENLRAKCVELKNK